MASEIVLVDLSSIAHPIWHMCGAEPDPNACAQKIVAKVRSLAGGKPFVAICCDKGKSFRHELDPNYKANRPQQDAALQHQITLAREILEADGFPVWAVAGFEADDLIASATAKALTDPDCTVAIVSADKDLLQLVNDRVHAISVRDGSTVDAAAVKAKFGVEPAQMTDYLALVGDTSDNVKGAKGIGPKKAADLLARFGSVESMYRDLKEVGQVTLGGFTPSLTTALREFEPIYPQTAALIRLRFDADIPFSDIFIARQPKDAQTFGMDESDPEDIMTTDTTPEPIAQPQPDTPTPAAPSAAPVTALQPVREMEVLAPAPAEWNKHLEPRSMGEAVKLAKYMHESRLFNAYGTPQAVLSTLIAGRELGLQSMAALRAIHIIEGKPTLSADLIRALVIRSGLAQYFRCTERTAERATFVTKRGDDPEFALTVTLEEMRRAWPKDQAAWDKSGWGKNPADMLVARAGSKLARLVYPDVVHGVYTPEEMQESREVAA
jgi:5'-3' exonuclease